MFKGIISFLWLSRSNFVMGGGGGGGGGLPGVCSFIELGCW